MLIYVIDPDFQSREVLVSRIRDALRQVQLKRVEILDGDFDLLIANAGGEAPTIAFLGPGCYSSIEGAVTRFRSFHSKTPLAAVLDNAVYTSEALDLRRYLSVRVMPLADVAQMAQFILDNSSSAPQVSHSGFQGVVAVTQLKGGVGCTSIAAALASCWARHELKVVLLELDDLNPQLTGWAGVRLGHRRAFSEMLLEGKVPANRLPEICWAVPGYDGNLSVIGLPELYQESFHLKADILEGAASSAEFIQSLIGVLSKHFDVVVADTGRSWGISTFSLLPLSQHVITILNDDESTVVRTTTNLRRLSRESDDSAEFDFKKWSFVLNGYTGEGVNAEAVWQKLLDEEFIVGEKELALVPTSTIGKEWNMTGEAGVNGGQEGDGPSTLFEYGDDEFRRAIIQLAHSHIPFRHEEIVEGGTSIRKQIAKLVEFLS